MFFICATSIIKAQLAFAQKWTGGVTDVSYVSNCICRPYTKTPVTLGDLFEYRTWCYNDSTAGLIQTFYKYNENSREYEAVYFKQEYYHFHYPQFDEFINWMEEKYKEKEK